LPQSPEPTPPILGLEDACSGSQITPGIKEVLAKDRLPSYEPNAKANIEVNLFRVALERLARKCTKDPSNHDLVVGLHAIRAI
jgi:hypothetical protein